jgi:hypothetical protein
MMNSFTNSRQFKMLSLLLVCFLAFKQQGNTQVVFDDAYGAGVTFAPFGGSTNTLTVDNTEHYSGTASLKIAVNIPGGGYTGGALVSATPTNLTAYNTISFWAKASAAKTLNVAGIGNNSVSTTYYVERTAIALTTTWTKYYIPVPNAAKLTAEDGLFHFAEGSDEGVYDIWMDDIQYENTSAVGTPVASITTETRTLLVGATFNVNGAMVAIPVNGVNQPLIVANTYFTFISSNLSVATFNAAGLGTVLGSGMSSITATLGATPVSGITTINVVAGALTPTTSAPTPPARMTANVVSLFSGAYANVPVATWRTPWSPGAVVQSDFTIPSTTDVTKKYTNLTYVGIEMTAPTIDATLMTDFHLDLWSPDATSFSVKLVDFGADGNYGGGDDKEHELPFTSPTLVTGSWVSFDLPLSAFTGLLTRGHLAQMILVSSNSTVYVDNIYFYKTPSVVPLVSAPTPPVRLPANVVSLFSDAYTNVPVSTWRTPWSPGAVVQSDYTIPATTDVTKKYTNLSYVGIEMTAPTVDASLMTGFHLDMWSPDATSFNIKLVDFGADGNYGGGDDKEHELAFTAPLVVTNSWVSFDVPLTAFTGLTTTGHIAQMILVSSTSTVFVDNIYFYKLPATSPLVSAPTPPTRLPANVVSLFTDAYTNVPVTTWRTPWSPGAIVQSDYTIPATTDIAKKYTNLTYVGIEMTAPTVNASLMTNFHLDLWSPDATSFNIKLVDIGADGAFGGGDDKEHELAFTAPTVVTGSWVSIDVPMSAFTGLTTTGHIAQMILVSNNSTVFVDNIYFYKTPSIVPLVSAPTPPNRAVGNVVSLFSDAYTNVPVTTWRTPWSPGAVVQSDYNIPATTDVTKKYTNLSYVGIEMTSPTVDASLMTDFHLDLWSPDATSFSVKLVDFGADGNYGGGDDKEHELPFTSPTLVTAFTNLATRGHIAQMILVSSISTVFVDNIYFYKTPPTAPMVSAPTPSPMAAVDVLSVYGEPHAASQVPVSSYRTSWSSAIMTDHAITPTDMAKKYTNLDYVGIEFPSPFIDASLMNNFHIDVWTPNATTFNVKLVDFGGDGAYGGGDDAEQQWTYTPATATHLVIGTWVSINIPINNVGSALTTGHIGQIILSSNFTAFTGAQSGHRSPNAFGTVFVDNMYFSVNTPLPIELLSFDAKPTAQREVQINWATASEKNSAQFDLQRSADGKEWKTINSQKAAGNSSIRVDYAHLDKSPLNGINYYRLSELDNDGKISLSAIKSVVFTQNTTTYAVYPNPNKGDIINISGNAADIQDLHLYAIDGREVPTTINNSGSTEIQVSPKVQLAEGIYIISIKTSTGTTNQRVHITH